MSELQWEKKNSHDYVSNSDLWIKDASFNMQKNGWELYDAVELLGEFNTFKSAKAYAKMLIDSGAYYCYTIDRR